MPIEHLLRGLQEFLMHLVDLLLRGVLHLGEKRRGGKTKKAAGGFEGGFSSEKQKKRLVFKGNEEDKGQVKHTKNNLKRFGEKC